MTPADRLTSELTPELTPDAHAPAAPHVHGPDCAHGHDLDPESYDPNLLLKKQPVYRTEPKVGRNDACPCGSGKKYKKCHGA